MTTDITLEDEESPLKALLNLVLVLAFTLVFFVVASVFLFGAVHWLIFHEAEDLHLFEHSAIRVWDSPLYVFSVYSNWWQALVHRIRTFDICWALFLPLLAPLTSIYALYFAFMKSSYSFNFWYILNNHFAKIKDVEHMGLHKGVLLVLGRFHDYVLGVSRPSNVLCIGETGSGKTSSVAIPSILRSDHVSILAVDHAGTLARHTSGHRAEIGKVFYFNWDLPDEEDKGIVYPKWNPLSIEKLPEKGRKREEYIKKIASYLVFAEEEVHDDNYWFWLGQNVMTTMLGFLVDKISHAMANDYFLDRIIDKGSLKKEERETLLSYYLLMPEPCVKEVIKKLRSSAVISIDDYVPIGSWEGVPSSWQGKDLCLGMLTDWLLQHYLTSKDKGEYNDWQSWVEALLVEAGLFNYGTNIIHGLEQFLYLSRQQRQIVFVCMLRPLKSFINQVIRDKTSVNDFDVTDLKGIKNAETGELEPVSVYVVAKTKSARFVSRMFVDLVLEQGIIEGKSKAGYPLLVVLDDVGQMLRVRTLADAVAKGPMMRTSFLLLCNSLNNVENTYSKETLEELVSYANYKIVLAEDNKKMSRQLKKLAIFATKSVQISQDKRRSMRGRKIFADANYFHRLAKDFETKKDLRIKTRDYQVVLVEGYYNRPILAKNIHYIKDEKFKQKAIKEACYGLSPQVFEKRNIQDLKTPSIDEVLYDVDLGIEDEVELKQFMNMAYDDAKSKMPEESDVNSMMASTISSKWHGEEGIQISTEAKNDEWWLKENAFDVASSSAAQNPFAKK